MDARRSQLCPRCGSPIPVTDSLTRVDGQCPSCGLGFTTAPLTAKKGPLATLGRRLRSPRRARSSISRTDLESCSFTVYGLDETWPGERGVGGWGRSQKELTSLTLEFSVPGDGTAPHLRVETNTKPGGLRATATTLAQYIWSAGADYSNALQDTFTAEDPTAGWEPVQIPVQDRPHEFRGLMADDRWVAIGQLGGSVVGINARRSTPGDYGLAPIPDLVAYLQDHRPAGT
jgi:hypothetical protein